MKEFLGQVCNIAIQETAFNNNFIASANFKSLLDRICSRFTPELRKREDATGSHLQMS
jgi:hypothetical protein